MNEDQDPRYQKAKERVEELKGFYVHLATYLIINFGIFLINILTNRDNLWFYWPLIGWGVGLAIHAFVVFGFEGPFGRHWEERKIRQLMDQDSGTTPA
jgi:hypothetical protein